MVLKDERHDQPALRLDAEGAEAVFVKARAGERFLQALGTSCTQRGACARVLERHVLAQ